MKHLFILIACCFCTSFLYAQQKKKEVNKKGIITKKVSSPTGDAGVASSTPDRNKLLKDDAVKVFAKNTRPAKKRETPSGIPALDFFYYVFDVFFSVTFKPGKLTQ